LTFIIEKKLDMQEAPQVLLGNKPRQDPIFRGKIWSTLARLWKKLKLWTEGLSLLLNLDRG